MGGIQCHDDVKLDNIFISPTSSFLLGDLGNVREHAHSFHLTSTHLPHRDFARDDVDRAVRSYLTFLRACSGDQIWFDREFSRGVMDWSDFWWRYKANPMTARKLLDTDPFWKEGEGAGDEECDAFETRMNTMRDDQHQWKEGKGKKPEWKTTVPMNTQTREYHTKPDADTKSSPNTKADTDTKSDEDVIFPIPATFNPIVALKEKGIIGSHPSRAKAGKMSDKELSIWIDDELSCLNLGLFESWLPGAPSKKGGLSESSY